MQVLHDAALAQISPCRFQPGHDCICCSTRSRYDGRLPASLADGPCHVGANQCTLEQARKPGPFADVKPEPRPRVVSLEMKAAFTRSRSACICSMIKWRLMHGHLETLHEAGCLPAIASYEGQYAQQRSKCRTFKVLERPHCWCTDTFPCPASADRIGPHQRLPVRCSTLPSCSAYLST